MRFADKTGLKELFSNVEGCDELYKMLQEIFKVDQK